MAILPRTPKVSMSSPPSFHAAIDVRPDGAEGRFAASLSPEWTVGSKPNGGYLMAVIARAGHLAVEAAGQDHPHCLVSAATFVGSPDAAEAAIEVDLLRRGLGVTQLHATLTQGRSTLVDVSMTFARLDDHATRRYDSLPAPELAPFETCSRMISNPEGMVEVRVMEGTVVRMDPATMGWARGEHSGVADMRGWAELANGEEIDAESLLYLLDCFPPATFELDSKGWVPTVQLTSYVRALPAPGRVKIRQRAQVVDGGFVDEVCEIWDSTDRLVAQATQLAKVRF
jgi:hypothetical protein